MISFMVSVAMSPPRTPFSPPIVITSRFMTKQGHVILTTTESQYLYSGRRPVRTSTHHVVLEVAVVTLALIYPPTTHAQAKWSITVVHQIHHETSMATLVHSSVCSMIRDPRVQGQQLARVPSSVLQDQPYSPPYSSTLPTTTTSSSSPSPHHHHQHQNSDHLKEDHHHYDGCDSDEDRPQAPRPLVSPVFVDQCRLALLEASRHAAAAEEVDYDSRSRSSISVSAHPGATHSTSRRTAAPTAAAVSLAERWMSL
jgi:hypothetical protein